MTFQEEREAEELEYLMKMPGINRRNKPEVLARVAELTQKLASVAPKKPRASSQAALR